MTLSYGTSTISNFHYYQILHELIEKDDIQDTSQFIDYNSLHYMA